MRDLTRTTDTPETSEAHDPDALPGMDELSVLKSRAAMMGIKFSNNIGLDALKEKIRAKMAAESAAPETEPADAEETTVVLAAPAGAAAAKPLTLRQKVWAENMKLVRLRITNLDPKKKDLPGEILTVANEYLGTVRKFVPFGSVTDNGYHVPWCIYEVLRTREFLSITVRKTPNSRQETIERRLVPEFALEVLPPLTPAEIAKLAAAQQAAGGLA